jgi:hypothetical protein
MSDAPTTTKPSEVATDGFLTKDALTSGAHFKTEEGEIDLPELGGKVLIRGVSFKEQRQIQSQLPNTIQGFTIKHTALSLSKYVKAPALTQDEWEKVLSNPNLPATAVTRINKKIAEVMDITDAEEQAVADEFPGAED